MLELRGIRKRFGGVTALRDGNLEVRAGEVHLLMGENGAGKSTLMTDSFSYLGDGNLLGVSRFRCGCWRCARCSCTFCWRTRRPGGIHLRSEETKRRLITRGVPIKFHLTTVYGIAGVLTGLAGMIEASRLMTPR